MLPRCFYFLCALLVFAASTAFSQKYTVVLDPGHGGQRIKGRSDGSQASHGSSGNNAQSASGKILEKTLTLEYSKAIREAFAVSKTARQMGGVKVVLTRETDKNLSAMGRAVYAVEYNADVFLSIHFNGSGNHKADGTHVYIVSKEHPKWEYYHFTNPYHRQDNYFAGILAGSVAKALQPFGGNPANSAVKGDSVGDGGHLKDGIRFLGYARMDTHQYKSAVALLEVEFMDNPKVESWLLGPRKEEVKRATANATVEAICHYLKTRDKYTAKFPLKAR